ncbi:MAG TPA: efflux RND transporter periplasmic adaptor subunit [Anaeromyxobacteraceae bacterium]|nr:efflux RND transporter periplasmic adaptor subunit [Anaeromyxobacteraceae bacterium]
MNPSPSEVRAPRKGLRRWAVGGLALVAVLAAFAWFARGRSGGGGAPAAPDPAQRVVPVTSATVARKDVPTWLEGLGTVVAYKTITVKSQVDGRLMEVHFREGDAVKKGQLLAQIDPRPFEVQLHQAEGALARDEAQLANARLNEKRAQALWDRQLNARSNVDDAVAAVGQLEGTVAVDRAAIESARLNLDYTRITSPVDGVTGVRLVDPGNLVRTVDAGGIVVVTQLDPIAVLFTLPQDDLPRISAQMRKGKLEVEAYSRDGSTLLGKGQLELVDNQINQSTATIRLKAIFPNPGRALWPNQFVKARLLLDTRKGALVVPATALQRGPTGSFVYVIGKDDTVQPRPVRAEPPTGQLAIVDEGLEEGERVVADGQGQLRAGARVSAKDRPAPPGGAPAGATGPAAR